jgi:hypothetical protein
MVGVVAESNGGIANIWIELVKEKGNALKLAWKANLSIDRVRGIWTQFKDFLGGAKHLCRSVRRPRGCCTTVIGAGFFHRQSLP